MNRISYGNAAGTVGRIEFEGRVLDTVLPPADGEARSIYDLLISSGVVPEPYAPPAPGPREATGAALLAALTDSEAALAATVKLRDQWAVLARGDDLIPETNAKLGRMAGKAGITVSAWFDRLA